MKKTAKWYIIGIIASGIAAGAFTMYGWTGRDIRV